MSEAPQSAAPKESRADAGAAGVGGGTLLVVLANSLPETSTHKSWLLLAAPSVSVALSVAWLWCRLKIANYMRDREVASVFAATRTTLAAAIADPHASEEHRADLRKQLEELDRIAVARQMEKVKLIQPLGAESFAKAGK